MPDHWRLGVVDRCVLEALDRIGARPDGHHRKCANVVDVLAEEFGVGPRYGYDALCLMAQPWRVHARLVDFHGNYGSANDIDPPANPRYTEARLSRAGLAALAAERGGPRLPIRLINGDLHVDGSAPPFSPSRVVATLLALVDDPALSDREIVAGIGPPESPTGCEIGCDDVALAAGKPTGLVMTAHLTHERTEREQLIVLSHPPLGIGDATIAEAIAARVQVARGSRARGDDALAELGLALRDVRNETRDDMTRVVGVLPAGADASFLESQILTTWGVVTRRRVRLPAPLPQLVRELVDADAAAQRGALAALLRDL